MQAIKEINVNELKQQMDEASGGFKLIDVRTPAEVMRGKIQGCEHIPLHVIPLKYQDFDAHTQLIIYCRTGARSAQACAFMQSKGMDNVFNLRGGIVSWAQMGFPIVT